MSYVVNHAIVNIEYIQERVGLVQECTEAFDFQISLVNVPGQKQ